MLNNKSYISFKENIKTVQSCNNWSELEELSQKINHQLSIKKVYNTRLREVEERMSEILCDQSWMGTCANYQLHSGGKRFRAILALISADIFKVDSETAINAAVCCEFIHNASLIHDDLQDRDLLRRGLPTIWNRFGDHTAINLGDYFVSGSFQALSKINTNHRNICKAIENLSLTIQTAVKGQSHEILERYNLDLKMQDYEATARAKTGSLICWPIKLIMILKGEDQRNDGFFKPLYDAGLAYQIQDDLSDFLGLKDRGLPGRDLKEGKLNVLIMHFLETATSGERFLLKQFLNKKYESISEDDILNWIHIIKSKGIIEKSIEHLLSVSKNAIDKSENFSSGLNKIVKFVVQSILERISEKIKDH